MNRRQTQDGLIGISIRDTQLRMTEALSGHDSRAIRKVARGQTAIPFTLSALEDRRTIAQFARDISDLYAASDFSATAASLAVDADFVLIKKIPTDYSLEEDELHEHVQWEVSQFMINPLDHFIVDYEEQGIAERTTQEKHLIVVTIRKKIVDYLREVFAQTNLQLMAIDVDVFAAQRVLTEAYNFPPDYKIALVEIRKKNLQFSLIHHGYHSSLEVDYPADESFDMLTSREEQLARIISKELRRIIIDTKLGQGVEEMNEIFVYGDQVNPGLLDALAQSHSVNLHRLNPFDRLPLDETPIDQEVTNHPEAFVTSVGVAIKGL